VAADAGQGTADSLSSTAGAHGQAAHSLRGVRRGRAGGAVAGHDGIGSQAET